MEEYSSDKSDQSDTMSESLSRKVVKLLQPDATDTDGSSKSLVINQLHQKTLSKLKKTKGITDLKEKDIKAINKRFMEGHLPRYRKHLVESEDSEDEDDDDISDDDITASKMATDKMNENVGYVKKMVEFVVQITDKLQRYALKYVSKAGQSWMVSLFPANQVYTLSLFLIYTYILTSNFMSVFVPLTVLILSFIALIISSIRILRGQRRFKEFLAWSDLLLSVDGAIHVEKAEANYFKNHISPVLSLIPAVSLAVMSLSAAPTYFVPEAPLALISLIFFAISCWTLHKSEDRLYMLAVACVILSTLTEPLYELLVQHDSSPFSIVIPGTETLALGVSFGALLKVYALILFLRVPFQKMYRCTAVGFMKSSVPLILISLWWQLFVLFYSKSSYSGLVQTFGVVIIGLISLPTSGFLLLLNMLRLIFTFNWVFLCATGGLLAVSLFYIRISKQQYSFSDLFAKLNVGPSLRLVMYILLGFFGLFLFVVLKPSGLHIHSSTLKEDMYVAACQQKLTFSSHLLQQEACHELSGHHVENWTGKVVDVSISSIENKVESVANNLPSSFANWISCTYGEEYPQPEHCQDSETNKYLCEMAKISERPCHLKKYNRYKFSVTASLTNADDQSINLSGHHSFYETLLNLKPEEVVYFSGELKPDSNTIILSNLRTSDKFNSIDREESPYTTVQTALLSLFKFLFYPVLVFV